MQWEYMTIDLTELHPRSDDAALLNEAGAPRDQTRSFIDQIPPAKRPLGYSASKHKTLPRKECLHCKLYVTPCGPHNGLRRPYLFPLRACALSTTEQWLCHRVSWERLVRLAAARPEELPATQWCARA
jgi:hypothetical protein